MKHLLEKARKTVQVTFLNEKVDVIKLSVAQVESFQERMKTVKEEDGLAVQRDIIRMGVVGADELTDDELNSFPMDDLTRLAEEVLKHAGVRTAEGK